MIQWSEMIETEISQYFRPPIQEELRLRYEKSLAATWRWQGVFWPPDREENDYDHVLGIYELKAKIKPLCPNLFNEIDEPTVDKMIYIHDGGEISKSVGDLARHVLNYDERKAQHRLRERHAFEVIVRRNIKDIGLQNEILVLYGRCIDKKDGESLLTSVIDKMQGNRYAFDHVFNRIRKPGEKQMVFNHAVDYIGEPIRALSQLVSKEAKNEIAEIYKGELQYYSGNGYRIQARPYLNKMKINLQVV